MVRKRWATVLVGLALVSAAAGALAAPDPAETASAPRADDSALVARAARPMSLYQLLSAGGVVMVPLGLCSILAMAYAIERASALRRRRILPPEFVENVRLMAGERPLDREKILMYCAAEPSPASRVIQAALKRLGRPLPEIEKSVEDAGVREVRGLRRNCRVLSGVATIAPMLGLLGTVAGMIRCFMELSAGDGLARSERLASGIYQALVATGAGLVIAIPAAVAYMVCTARIERLVGELDDVAAEFIETTTAPEDKTAKDLDDELDDILESE